MSDAHIPDHHELLEVLASALPPRDALQHTLHFLERAVPFDSALLFFQNRAEKYSQIILEYNKKGILRGRRVFRAPRYRTPVGRKLFGEDYRSIAVIDDVQRAKGRPEDLLRMGYEYRSSLGMILHVDDADNVLLGLVFISGDPQAFGPLHADLLQELRAVLTVATRPFFLSRSDELILLGPEGPLPSNSEALLRRCPDLRRMMSLVDVVAPTESTVLILGPTGSGKGVTAEAIHQLSPRSRGPFVQVNCASIPESLLESELFGFEKGAFIGAQAVHRGYFEQAGHGTLFLDEVGELSLSAQAKLLHVLEKREIVRIGGERHIPVDVRIVAATHRDLNRMVASGSFREDLLYRLNVFPLAVPPLSARRADIPVLAEYFYRIFARRMNDKVVARIGREGLRILERLPWPGNVRQLSHVVERAMLMSIAHGGSVLRFDEDVLDGMEETETAPRLVSERELRAALEKSGWRIQGPGGAAELLNLPPATVRSRMKSLNIPLPRAMRRKMSTKKESPQSRPSLKSSGG